MSTVYTEKLYPDISSASEDESQQYRLQKIDELEHFLRDEVTSRAKLAKQFKRRANAVNISSTTVVTVITTLEIGAVATLSTGIGAPIGIGLASAGIFLGIASAILHKTQKVFDSKAKKHDNIKTLAEAKLDSISGLVSKAIEDANVSHQEYQLILKEVEHYRSLKEQIRTKSKRVTDAISAEQREAILQEGRKQGKDDFLKQIASTSDTQPVNAM